MRHELILGGARSGKSAYALAAAKAHGDAVSWVATAEPFDDEMRERIAAHRAERPATWRSIEAPLALAAAITSEAANGRCVVVDCLTLWLSNCLLHPDASTWPTQRQALLTLLAESGRLPGRLLLVSNEVGSGIVPENALARRFRDEAGRLHQALAARLPRVTLVVAGIPMHIKRES